MAVPLGPAGGLQLKVLTRCCLLSSSMEPFRQTLGLDHSSKRIHESKRKFRVLFFALQRFQETEVGMSSCISSMAYMENFFPLEVSDDKQAHFVFHSALWQLPQEYQHSFWLSSC